MELTIISTVAVGLIALQIFRKVVNKRGLGDVLDNSPTFAAVVRGSINNIDGIKLSSFSLLSREGKSLIFVDKGTPHGMYGTAEVLFKVDDLGDSVRLLAIEKSPFLSRRPVTYERFKVFCNEIGLVYGTSEVKIDELSHPKSSSEKLMYWIKPLTIAILALSIFLVVMYFLYGPNGLIEQHLF